MPYRVLLLGLIALAYAAPWPIVVNTAAWLMGDPVVYAFEINTEQWAHHTLYFALFLVVAAVLWSEDRWLAAIVAMLGAQTFILGPHVTTLYFLLGVGILMMARRMPPRWRDAALSWLGWSAALQSFVMLAQWWKGVPGVGTFGVSGLAACYVAMVGMLMPAWLLPLVGAAVACSGSKWGAVAFVVGLGVRFAPVAAGSPAVVVCALLAVVACAFTYASVRGVKSGDARIAIHRLGYDDWRSSTAAVLVGHGLGRWHQRMKARVERAGFAAINEGPASPKYYTAAHDDALQWLYETGLLGALLLSGWFWTWRRRLLAPPFAPALAVIAVMALAWFPFHDLRTGCIAALFAGLGSPMNEGA